VRCVFKLGNAIGIQAGCWGGNLHCFLRSVPGLWEVQEGERDKRGDMGGEVGEMEI